MSPGPAYGEDTSTALSLVNTKVSGTSGIFDRLTDEGALARWLRCQLVEATSSPEHGRLARFQQLRADTRVLLSALQQQQALPQEALDRINATATEPVRPVLSTNRTLRWEPINPGSAEAKIARDLIRLVSSPDGTRLRICAAEDCDRMFIQDHGRTVWCSPTCGNRIRARRHAALRRTERT
jgi:predicted RNA-binding Zn ribbon-like protein